jgi:hypothetical protein
VDAVPGPEPVKTLRLIGYWAGPGAEEWPDPRLFARPGPDAAGRQRVLEYLRAGTVYVAAGGPSFCRFCGAANGSVELTDGEHFVWPEGLAHYVSDHDVCLPGAVTALMARLPTPVDALAFEHALFQTRRIKIDSDWWGSLRDPASSRES